MPTIAMANQKGGSGKTTAAMVLAGEVIALGGKVAFVEGDPNRHLARWAQQRGEPVIDAAVTKIATKAEASAAIDSVAGDARIIVITTDNDHRAVFEWLEAAAEWAHFVIADPEGSGNQWMASAMSQADLVVIPFSPTAMDANQVSETLLHLRSIEKMSRKPIPFRILLTRANPVATRDERDLRKNMIGKGLPMMSTFLLDRPAFRALFMRASLLQELSEEDVNGLAKARANAAAFLKEVVEAIDAGATGEVAA